MISNFLLGISSVGAEWVLVLLLLISVLSVTLIVERAIFYRRATAGLETFRTQIRMALAKGALDEALLRASERGQEKSGEAADLETEMVHTLLSQASQTSPAALNELAQDCVLRARLQWDRNLAMLATIGSNSPFVGLFGTVIGIIRAFADLAQSGGGAAQGVTAGISEALIATAVGILVAIPATVAFNLFQRRVRNGITQAEALKSYLLAATPAASLKDQV